MGLVSGSVSSLVNGVSQQPPWLRLPSPGAVQENFMSSLVDGLNRRPPTEHIARIQTAPLDPSACFIHTINRSEAEKYSVVLTNTGIKVFDLNDGSLKTVNAPHGLGYLATTTPKTSFACTTIADRWCAATSCSSRAIRARSRATAASARSRYAATTPAVCTLSSSA